MAEDKKDIKNIKDGKPDIKPDNDVLDDLFKLSDEEKIRLADEKKKTADAKKKADEILKKYPHPEPLKHQKPPVKKPVPNDDLKSDNEVESIYKKLIRDSLKKLDSLNADMATILNGEGFSRDDGVMAVILLNKEDWNEAEVSEAFEIAKHYSKTQLKNEWGEIIKLHKKINIKNINNEINNEIDKGLWVPIKWVNNQPAVYAGWEQENPYNLSIVENTYGIKYIKTKITLKNQDGEPIQDKIKRLKIDGVDMIEFNGEVFNKSEFVNITVYPGNVNLFTECLNALPIEEGEYKEPKFYIEDEIIKFPDKCYARRDVDYQKVLISGLNIGQMDFNVYKEGIDLLTPKQLTLYYGIIGANIINVIGFEDYLVTIDAIGESDTGKSFTIDMALAMDYGIFRAKMNDDALKSSFRHHAIANATNLPIYIEEALLDERSMSRLKSTGKNIRGNMDKSLTNYDVLATFIFSRNTESKDIKDIDAMEKKAQDKRIYKFVFDKNDVIDKVTQDKGKEFINRIKSMAGGMLYDKLKKKNINDIVKKYRELKRKEDDGRKVVSLLGAWIEDNPDFIPVVSKIEVPEIIDEFFAKMLSLHYNKEDAMHSSDGYKNLSYEDKEMQSEFKIEEDNKDNKKWIFQITVAGFNFIKKGLGINQSARNFADGNGFVYKTTYIEGNRNMGIEGSLPDKYAEMLNEKETEKETKTKTKTEKTENNVNIWTGNVPSPEDLGL